MPHERTGGARHTQPQVRLPGRICVKLLDSCTELLATAAAVAGVRRDRGGDRGCEGCLGRAPRHHHPALRALMCTVSPRVPIRVADSVQSINQPQLG